MLVVLVGAGAFVFWRVQVALDRRLDQDLRRQTSDLREAAIEQTPTAALASVRDRTRKAQLVTADGLVLATGRTAGDNPLLTQEQARSASDAELRTGYGDLLSEAGQHVRILAVPIPGNHRAAVAVTAVGLGPRDEALRELLAQLALGNGLALALASIVGYRMARAALDPVERYRAQAEQIAQGATDIRLEVPAGPTDEIARLGTTLNAMLDAQQHASNRQQQFIDDASHELRTPLSTLCAEIDLALRKPRPSNEYEATLRRLAADTQQLIDLSEALLTVGALGTATPAASQNPARDLIGAAARRARGQLDEGNSRTVEMRVPGDPTVYADAGLLGRALGNLVDNAVRYGEGTITIAVDDLPGFGSILTVHDEGAGIPAGFIGHAAERFRRDESSRSGPGAGLGLSIVDAIMIAHRGQLRICSAGSHHQQPGGNPGLAQVPCHHPETGTAISLLLPGAPRSGPH